MTPNNNLSVLPFYKVVGEQNHFKSYAYGEIYPLITKRGAIPPCEIMLEEYVDPDNFDIETTWYNADGTINNNNPEPIGKLVEKVVDGVLKQFILFDGSVKRFGSAFPNNMLQGRYYFSVTEWDSGATFVSDIFTIVDDVDDFLTLEWTDEEDITSGGKAFLYENATFINRLFICSEIGKPDYDFIEEGETRDGVFFAEKQISAKHYKFTFLAPEYLCDVLRFVRMADYVQITDAFGRKYNVDTILFTPKWQTQGDLASVEVEFTADTVAKKIGKGIGTIKNPF